MAEDIKNVLGRQELLVSSELLKMEGVLYVISVLSLEEGEILIKDGTEVLIPQAQRQPMLTKLHSTHLSDVSMLKLACGSFFWPGITAKIRYMYKACQPCMINRID